MALRRFTEMSLVFVTDLPLSCLLVCLITVNLVKVSTSSPLVLTTASCFSFPLALLRSTEGSQVFPGIQRFSAKSCLAQFFSGSDHGGLFLFPHGLVEKYRRGSGVPTAFSSFLAKSCLAQSLSGSDQDRQTVSPCSRLCQDLQKCFWCLQWIQLNPS